MQRVTLTDDSKDADGQRPLVLLCNGSLKGRQAASYELNIVLTHAPVQNEITTSMSIQT